MGRGTPGLVDSRESRVGGGGRRKRGIGGKESARRRQGTGEKCAVSANVQCRRGGGQGRRIGGGVNKGRGGRVYSPRGPGRDGVQNGRSRMGSSVVRPSMPRTRGGHGHASDQWCVTNACLSRGGGDEDCGPVMGAARRVAGCRRAGWHGGSLPPVAGWLAGWPAQLPPEADASVADGWATASASRWAEGRTDGRRVGPAAAPD